MSDRELMELIYKDVRDVKGDVRVLKEDVQNLKERVTGIETKIENVICPNIRVVAEGHLDLNRKLNDALRADKERELHLIRMSILEYDVDNLKSQVSKMV